MDAVQAAEAIVAAAAKAMRDEFYGDEQIWQHEYCGTECNGEDH